MDGTSDSARSDWGPFGRPLFDDPQARKLSRVGVIDIGSNSVRLVVFDGAARSPAYFFNEKVMAGLGAGMAETGRLNPEGKKRALTAMMRFSALARGMDLPPLTAVATAAMRDAEDGPAFRAELEEKTGLKIWVIDGKEEARLSAQGVLLGWPGADGLICDIGGSSMELAEISAGQVGKRVTSALGPLKFRELDDKARAKHIRKQVARLAEALPKRGQRLFLVGGSWRAIARIDMERRDYPLHVLHEYRMSVDSALDTLKFIGKSDPDMLRAKCSLSSARMSLVPYAGEVLREVLDIFEPSEIAISSYGIREGLLYEQMPQSLRDRDPLVEACRFAEKKDARLPGFGKTLYAFVKPLFADASPDRMRLVKAACLLHDVSWRAHPDYRAETCFETATRANLGGMTHEERVWLGMALLHRYKNKRDGTRFDAFFTLLDADQQTEAEILGKAMRFGAMLWMSEASEQGARLDWSPKDKQLTLRLIPEAAPLMGEVAESRLKSLANALGAEDPKVEIVGP